MYAIRSYYATELVNLPLETTQEIKQIFNNYYGIVDFEESDYSPIIELLKYDKKNNHGNINFVLLKAIGEPVVITSYSIHYTKLYE